MSAFTATNNYRMQAVRSYRASCSRPPHLDVKEDDWDGLPIRRFRWVVFLVNIFQQTIDSLSDPACFGEIPYKPVKPLMTSEKLQCLLDTFAREYPESKEEFSPCKEKAFYEQCLSGFYQRAGVVDPSMVSAATFSTMTASNLLFIASSVFVATENRILDTLWDHRADDSCLSMKEIREFYTIYIDAFTKSLAVRSPFVKYWAVERHS